MSLPTPAHLQPVFQKFLTVEYATSTSVGQPLTYPVTPYTGSNTLDVSTGLSYPAKAERARRNPKTCLLYSYPKGSNLNNPPTVLVYGHAAVRDANLQANTDRYVGYIAKNNVMPPFMLLAMGWYVSRIWVEVTPVRVLWWEGGDLDQAPQEWLAPQDTILPESDPTPKSDSLGRWKTAPNEWKEGAAYAAEHLGTPVVTVTDAAGYPVPFRVKQATLNDDGFQITLPKGAPITLQGKACLTFHSHPETFTGQENIVFTGEFVGNDGFFKVEKRPGDWSLPPKGLGAIFGMFGNSFKLRPRVKAEAERRGQPVPKVNLPAKA